MNTALLQTALFIAEQLFKHAPEMYAQLREIFSKPDITADEIRVRREALAAQKYEDFVPNTEDKLPPGVPEM